MSEPAKRLCIYLEDAPVVETRSATGLSKALIPMLHEIARRTSQALVMQAHEHLHDRDILQFCPNLTVARRRHYRVAQKTSQLPFLLAAVVARAHGTWLGLAQRRGVRDRARLTLWSAVGVDPLSLTRARACAAAMGLPFEIYLVDDIETHPANAGKVGLHSTLRRALRAARRVYTISAELGVRCSARYGIECTPLPLTATAPTPISDCRAAPQHFAAYLGGINHLYEEGLRLLIELVSDLRASSGRELTVRIIARAEDVARLCAGAAPEWVISGVEASQDGLASTLSNSDFCYLPYSPAESARIMVGSSFPSKLLDYLAWARHIVVFAPKGSVPFELFSREGLDFVTDSEDALSARLKLLMNAPQNSTGSYRRTLDRNHGPGRATSVIFGGA